MNAIDDKENNEELNLKKGNFLIYDKLVKENNNVKLVIKDIIVKEVLDIETKTSPCD